MGVYEDLGVKTIINAWGNATLTGGSIMRPEVLASMEEASRSYVWLPELLEKAGERVAELAGVEAAYITSGAAAGIAISVAACMAGTDHDKMLQLPDTTGMKDEVIVQASQIGGYDNMIEIAGGKVVAVGDEHGTNAEQLEAAFSEQTVALVHFFAYASAGDVPLEQVIETAHERGVTVIVDAAAEFPPYPVLRRFIDMGADLAIFSGGKGLRGPQCTGLVLGRRDLIEACAVQASPNHGVGRPTKVGKEEIVGLVTALELYATECHSAGGENELGRALRPHVIRDIPRPRRSSLYRGSRPHLPARSQRGNAGGHSGHPGPVGQLGHSDDPGRGREGALRGQHRHKGGADEDGLTISPHTLQDGEERIVAQRVAQVLGSLPGGSDRTLRPSSAGQARLKTWKRWRRDSVTYSRSLSSTWMLTGSQKKGSVWEEAL